MSALLDSGSKLIGRVTSWPLTSEHRGFPVGNLQVVELLLVKMCVSPMMMMMMRSNFHPVLSACPSLSVWPLSLLQLTLPLPVLKVKLYVRQQFGLWNFCLCFGGKRLDDSRSKSLDEGNILLSLLFVFVLSKFFVTVRKSVWHFYHAVAIVAVCFENDAWFVCFFLKNRQ